MARDYKWSELQERGDWVHNPGTLVNQVARLAKKYVARNLPEGSQVTTVTTPDGTVTFLSYVPEVVEDAQPTAVEQRQPTKRQSELATRAEERRLLAEERDAENRRIGAQGVRNILKNVEGFAAWDHDLSSEERAKRQDKWTRAKADGASKSELEDILRGVEESDDED